MGVGWCMEVTGQVLTLFMVSRLWFRNGLPSLVHDWQPLVADSLGANVTAPVDDEGVVAFADSSAVAHTALLLAGLLVGHILVRHLGAAGAVGTACGAAGVLYLAMASTPAWQMITPPSYVTALLGTVGKEQTAHVVAAVQSMWALAGLLLPLVDRRTVGIFPEATVRYLPTMTAVYLGAFVFFHSLLPLSWNSYLRHAARGILGLEGSFPEVSDAELVAEHGLFLSTTHVLALSAGIAACYYMRLFIHKIDSALDPIPSAPTVQRGKSAAQTLLYLSLLGVLCYVWVQFVDALVSMTLGFRSRRLQLISEAFIGIADDGTARWAAQVTYGIWFVYGGLFELMWPVSESNRPRQAGATWRLRREDAGGVKAPGTSEVSPAKHDKIRGGPPPPPEHGWTATALPFGGLLALSMGTLGNQIPILLFALLFTIAAYRGTFYPEHLQSFETFDHNSERYKRIRAANFPPPYPNNWYRICNSVDLDGQRIKSISALGRELVAFRGADGRVGVLSAFCPHLGSHLGAGCVKGNSIQCPYHNWEFNADGRCTHIPYSRYNPPKGDAFVERTSAQAYEVREHLGMVFIWFDAEGRPPQWELKYHLDVMDTDKFYFATMAQMTFDMHLSEAHENSADWYHFQTLHRPFPIPGLSRFIAGRHKITRRYAEGELTGNGTGKGPDRDIPKQDGTEEHIVVFDEQMEAMYFLGMAMPCFNNTGGAHVVFEGPAMMHFTVDVPGGLGRLRMIKTFLPVEPFKTIVEVRWYAERQVCPHVVHFMKHIAANALVQDQEVWDRKLYRPVSEGHSHSKGKRPLTLADNDGPFRQFREWYSQFYSEHSADMADVSKLVW
eukprot:Hpha_TRINITY_DN15000_c1_g1::TRINITY_DN15000_c1_g1_i1::g.125325::m.125325/K14938/NVD, DAF36; cholesterol 7-desaturase